MLGIQEIDSGRVEPVDGAADDDFGAGRDCARKVEEPAERRRKVAVVPLFFAQVAAEVEQIEVQHEPGAGVRELQPGPVRNRIQIMLLDGARYEYGLHNNSPPCGYSTTPGGELQ